MTRAELASAIEAVLSGVAIVDRSKLQPTITNQTVNITNQGSWSGDVAGGDLTKTQSIKAMGDEVARLLAGDYRHDPEVRDIVESATASPDEKRTRLKTLLVGVRGFAVDVAATAITKLLPPGL